MYTYRIAHLTDLHILEENELNNGVDVRANFIQILNSIVNEGDIDLIVIGGDFTHQSTEDNTLYWIKEQLDKTNISYRVVPGNHDNSLQLAKVFNLEKEIEEGKLFYWDELSFGKIFYLDSSDGSLPMYQLNWVEEECSKSYQKFLIFMHHPPVLAEVKLMDHHHSLQNMNQVQKVFRNINNIQSIFCGHYHNERTIRMYNHLVMITPSTFVQIDSQKEEFAIGSYQIGWRKILWDGSSLTSYVKYL
ncbi:MAG: metallophosphoesterase [Chitinophagales bacterium]|nr:metallophosphoesterase [Chitinophagales bacterium]MCZ2394848.1 metallophosphoesterase [Chitinophagales bacterium]